MNQYVSVPDLDGDIKFINPKHVVAVDFYRYKNEHVLRLHLSYTWAVLTRSVVADWMAALKRLHEERLTSVALGREYYNKYKEAGSECSPSPTNT